MAVLGRAYENVLDATGEVTAIIGENLPTITDDLINQIKIAMKQLAYPGRISANPKTIAAFLNEHKGEQTFTVHWDAYQQFN